MNRLFALMNLQSGSFVGCALTSLWALLFCCSLSAFAQRTTPTIFSFQATHLLGLPNTKHNCNGTLSIENNTLQFQQKGKPTTLLSMGSVRNVFLGEESKQIGGLPMKVGKAAAPYGGGRVISLLAHKKYDTVSLEFADSEGGVHGAIFQMNKGQGKLLRDELLARGVSLDSSDAAEDQPGRLSTTEVTHENK